MLEAYLSLFVKAVFVENITDKRLLEQIANETGATIGGALYPGALSGSDGPASHLSRHDPSQCDDADAIARVLGGKQEKRS